MEKKICTYTYWLGVVSLAIAFVGRALDAVGVKSEVLTLSYKTFYKGAVLLLLTAVATTAYAWLKSQKL